MKSHSLRQIPHKYVQIVVLSVISGLSVFSFLLMNGRRDIQFLIGFAFALAYVLWGILYHMIERDLYPRVVVEYVGVATVGLALLYTVLFA